jgi:hypothetical protein
VGWSRRLRACQPQRPGQSRPGPPPLRASGSHRSPDHASTPTTRPAKPDTPPVASDQSGSEAVTTRDAPPRGPSPAPSMQAVSRPRRTPRPELLLLSYPTPRCRPTTTSSCRNRTALNIDQRDSGTPRSAGSAHAIALTWATCAGGKTPRSTRPRSLLKTLDALLAEPYSPLRHGLARARQSLRDLGGRQTLRGEQNRLRAHHIPARARVRRRATLQRAPLLITQGHLMRELCAITTGTGDRARTWNYRSTHIRRSPIR